MLEQKQLTDILEAKFLYNPDNKEFFCHAPTLLETGSGDLLVAWYAYPEVEHKDAHLVLIHRPKGKPWEASKKIMRRSVYSEGNPVLFQEPGGRIWLLFVILKGNYWTDAELNGSYSDDGGHSWEPAKCLWKKPGMMVRHPPVLLENNSLALPAYDEVTKEAVVLAASSPYTNWDILYRFSDLKLLQPVLIRQTRNNTSPLLTLFFRPWSEPRVIWRSHSNNEGIDWSAPIRTPLPNPLSGISAFTVGAHMAVVHNYTHEHQRHPLSISISRDRGVTWDPPKHLDTIKYEVSYPSFINGQNGVTHGVYTYNRRMIKYVALAEKSLS